MNIYWHQLRYLKLGACVLALAFSLYIERCYALSPCLICLLQRGVVLGLVITSIAQLSQLYRKGLKRWLWVLESGLLLLGFALVFRHLCLQAVGDSSGACLPPLTHLLEVMPLGEALRLVAHSSGECARILWAFLGLSLPAWLGVFYSVLLVFNIAEHRRMP